MLIVWLLIIIAPSTVYGESSGNTTPLQPSGVAIPSEKKWDIQTRFSYLQAKTRILFMLENEIVYSFNKYVGLDLDFYTMLYNRQGDQHSQGISDGIFSLTANLTTAEEALVNTKLGVKLPIGDPEKSPPTGTGSTDFAFEISFNHTSRRWYFASKFDALWAGNYRGKNNGDSFALELDLGPRFSTRGEKVSNFYLLWELVSEYNQQDIINVFPDPDSGGFLLRTGPRFTWERPDFAQLQVHFNVPIGQVPNGNQPFVELRSELFFEIRF